MPLATTQLSGAPALHLSGQLEIRTVAPGERLGTVVPTTVSDSGAAPVGAPGSAVGGAVVVGAAVVVVAGGAVVVGAEVVEVVVVGAAVVEVVVVGATVVVGGVSSAGSLAPAKVVGGLLVVVVVLVVVVADVGDGSSAVVVVVVVVDVGDVSAAVVVVDVGVPSSAGLSVGSSAEAASTWSDESDESPRLVIAHTPSPPITSTLTSKTILILSQF